MSGAGGKHAADLGLSARAPTHAILVALSCPHPPPCPVLSNNNRPSPTLVAPPVVPLPVARRQTRAEMSQVVRQAAATGAMLAVAREQDFYKSRVSVLEHRRIRADTAAWEAAGLCA